MTLARRAAHRLAHGLLMGACFVAAAIAQSDCRAAAVTVEFPDFPLGAVIVDLGQSLTIDAETHNDGGKGVTWSCSGDACTTLTTTPQWAAFHASGITGEAIVTATSIQQPSVRATVTVTVNLNLVPDMKCELIVPHAAFGV
jgi:hypothetical protein